MNVVCVGDDNVFMVRLNDDAGSLVAEWAQIGHTSSEEIIEEWLDAALTNHIQYVQEKESAHGMEGQNEGMGRG